jgi:protein-export membrane protein, SecD/SecF family
MEFFKRKTNFRFMEPRKWWYAIAGAFVIGSFALVAVRGLNLTVDFTGGVAIEAAFPNPPDLDAVRSGLERAGFEDAQAQNFGTSRDVMIRLPPIDAEEATQVRARVEEVLKEVDPGAEVRDLSVVGPQIGAELRESAIWAFVFTVLGIFFYVLFRFHTWRLSAGAIIATLFDPIVVLGFFALTQMPFDLSVVAAILAVIGYSLNDKVVIFDRIRERIHLSRRLPVIQVLNEAINETLSRTVMTAFSVLIVLIALYVFGGPVLQPFAAALLVGVILGHFSSIWVASALALDFGLKIEHLLPVERKHPVDNLP